MGPLHLNSISLMIVMLLLAIPTVSCTGASKDINNAPVPHFQVERFLGKWYEIARFNHKFERDLHYVTAEYSMRKDGKVRVMNTGYKNGKKSVSEGKAKIVNPRLKDGYLRVSFFLFFYADYRIMMLDEDYQYALIGSKKDNYLWILSRTPQLSDEVKDKILKEAQRRGYNIDHLIWVKQ